jgi:hypothetical protein
MRVVLLALVLAVAAAGDLLPRLRQVSVLSSFFFLLPFSRLFSPAPRPRVSHPFAR